MVSNWLAENLHIGERVEISGPKGKFCLVPGKIPKKILFLGAGSGVTPLMSMARWLFDVSANVDVKFFNSVRTSRDIIFEKEIELLTSRYRMFSPIIITTTREHEDEWVGLTGRINQSMLLRIAPDLTERHVYMCGPEGFMEAVRAILKDIGFDLSKLHTESFGGVRTSVEDKAKKRSTPRAAQPMLWCYELDAGRVFGCVPGHCAQTFDDPVFRTLLLRGIAWSAGESPGRFSESVAR